MVQEPAGPQVKRVGHEKRSLPVEGAEASAYVIDVHAGRLTEFAPPGKQKSDTMEAGPATHSAMLPVGS
jgi:hypothetical protein